MTPMTEEQTIAYPEWTKKGYREASEGDGLVMSRPFRARGTVQPQQSPTLTCTTGCGSGVVVGDRRGKDADPEDSPRALPDFEEGDVISVLTPGRVNKAQNGRLYKDDGSSFTITCQDIHGIASKESGRLRIRYLTPRECWRLMGFPDWAFDRAAEAGTTKTQLYKQAGNSIVVPVLQAIFEGMYQQDSWKTKRRTLDDFFGGE